MTLTKWSEIKRARPETAEMRVAYTRAERAFALGEQIRALRQARGLSQAELAKCAGTSQAAIARLEAGGVEPKFRTLDKVRAALGVTLEVRLVEPSANGQQVNWETTAAIAADAGAQRPSRPG